MDGAPVDGGAPVEREVPRKGLLFSQMQPPPGEEADFDDWYSSEHIPARMALPGFASASRYQAVEGTPDHLACYFLDDLGVLQTPAYRRLKSHPSPRTAHMLGTVTGFTRYTCVEISDTAGGSAPPEREPGVMMAVAFSVPDEDAEDFDAWYDSEHVPLLMEADGWLRVRRYRTLPGYDGPPWTHLALHELADLSALDAPERARARGTAWRARLAERPWFERSGRWLYRPIATATATAPADPTTATAAAAPAAAPAPAARPSD